MVRRWLPTFFTILGGLSLLAGLPALYVRTQVLDRPTFQSRSVAALQSAPVRQIVAQRITDQIVDAGATEVLTVEPIVVSALSSFEATPEFAGALRVATGNAHDVLISGRRGVVVDLGRTLDAVRAQIASVSPRIADRIPSDLRPTIVELDEKAPALKVLRSVDDWTTVTIGLLGGAVLSFAAAVALSTRRRHQLATIGTTMAAVGALLVVALAIARTATIDSAVNAVGADADTRAAITSAFEAFFGDFRGWAIGVLVLGIVLALVPATGDALDPARGPSRLRTILRHAFVPPESRAGRAAWGAIVALLGALVVLDPLDGARTVATLLGVVLVAAGLSVAVATADTPARTADGERHPERTRLGLTRTALLAAGVGLVATASVIAAVVVTTVERPEPAVASAPPQGCNGDRRLCALRLDQVTFPGTHNSFAAAEQPHWLFANQRYGISRQLHDGIRLFLLDVHVGVRQGGIVRTDLRAEGMDRNRVGRALGTDAVGAAERLIGPIGRDGLQGRRELFLCHTLCELGAQSLDSALADYKHFLDHDRGAVLVWSIEPYMKIEQLETALRRAGLLPMVAELSRGEPLPTLGQLVQTGRRIVVLSERGGGERRWFMPEWSFVQDTPLGAKKPEDVRCTPSRGDADSPLLAVNHWIDAFPPPPRANAAIGHSFLRERLARCERLRRMHPNLVPVDFYDTSGIVEIARERNEEAIAEAERIANGATLEARATP